MSHIDQLLASLGYDKPKFDVTDCDTITDLIPKSKQCGIYVLHFSNDEFYAGLSIDVCTRFTQHQKTYDDIDYLSFKTIELSKLRNEEERIIKKLETEGFKLRNKVHTSVTVASSPFDEIMDDKSQERWLTDFSFNDISGDRSEDEDLRRKYRRNFQKLNTLPHSNEAIKFLQEYIPQGIPAPRQTELYYWSCSCLPSNSQSLYVRVNITQEVLQIFNYGDNLGFVFYLAKSSLHNGKSFSIIWNTIRNYIRYKATPNFHHYKTGGQDQIRIAIIGIDNALKALQVDKFLHAIRTFNLRIMRKTFNLQYRSHCYDLADTALDALYD